MIATQPPSPLPIAQATAQYVSVLRGRGVAVKYANDCEVRLGKVFGRIGYATVDQIARRDVEATLATMRAELDWTASTRNHHAISVKGFTRWLHLEGLLPADPLAHLGKVRETDTRRVRRALTDDEAKRLLEMTAEARERAGATREDRVSGQTRALVYRIALDTGLRMGEIRGLRVRDVDLRPERARITVPASVAKARKVQAVPLAEGLAEAMRFHVRGKGEADPLFSMPENKCLFVRWIKGDLKAAAIRYKTAEGYVDGHSLRHTAITRWSSQGATPAVLQKLARHADLRVTTRYLHAGEDELRSVVHKTAGEDAPRTARPDHPDSRPVGVNADRPAVNVASREATGRVEGSSPFARFEVRQAPSGAAI